MAIVTLDGGQSSAALAGQSTTFIQQKIQGEFPAAPDSVIASKLSDTIRDFYTSTAAWREVIGPYNISSNQLNIDINPVDQYSQFQYVFGAWLFAPTGSVGANVLGACQAYPMVALPRRAFGLQFQTPGPYPLWYWMETPTRMWLYQPPQAALGQVLWIYGALLPLVNTPVLPPIATTHHLDALMSGTIARLCRMPKKPWSDKDAVMEHERIYKRESRKARDLANRSYTNATAPWRFPSFAGTNNNQGTSQMGIFG